MLDLDSARWSELRHAYGAASDIPALLSGLKEIPDASGDDEPWASLFSALAHQGDVYSASFAAVPHVIAALAAAPLKAGSVYFQFPAWVEICRRNKGVEIPADLKAGYLDALARLPALAAQAAGRDWDDEFLRGVLAAIAAAKGSAAVAEAALELSPTVAGWPALYSFRSIFASSVGAVTIAS
jgi:hypothetical protein